MSAATVRRWSRSDTSRPRAHAPLFKRAAPHVTTAVKTTAVATAPAVRATESRRRRQNAKKRLLTTLSKPYLLYAAEQRTKLRGRTAKEAIRPRTAKPRYRQRTTKNKGLRLMTSEAMSHICSAPPSNSSSSERAARDRGPGASGDAVQTNVRRASGARPRRASGRRGNFVDLVSARSSLLMLPRRSPRRNTVAPAAKACVDDLSKFAAARLSLTSALGDGGNNYEGGGRVAAAVAATWGLAGRRRIHSGDPSPSTPSSRATLEAPPLF